MPGDLKDPEQMFPFYYDSRYCEAPNPFEPGPKNMDGYLQSISNEELGRKLNTEELDDLKRNLDSKGFFHRNPGEESFRCEVCKQIKRLAMARKVARKWPTSTN